MKVLAIYEAPCVGTCEEVFECENPSQAHAIAWERTCQVKEYVMGGFEVYCICYNPKTHKHELEYIEPIDLYNDCEEVEAE